MRERDTEWLRRIELYLELGSDGIVVLVDRARDAILGDLVRALLGKHEDLAVVISPEELRDAPHGSVVLYHAEAEDVERLNLVRPVLKDRALRLVLWATGSLASELPLRAPDLYDWISHRVECPQEGVPRFVSRGLLAAEAADRPVDWLGSTEELTRAVGDAWPGRGLIDVSASRYDEVVDALSVVDAFVAVRARGDLDILRARWAMAEAHRHRGVALMRTHDTPDARRYGFWQVSAAQSALRSVPAEMRVPAAILDLEEAALSLPPPSLSLLRFVLDATVRTDSDPGAMMARALGDPAWPLIATGQASPPLLRAWGADPPPPDAMEPLAEYENLRWHATAILERDRALARPDASSMPPKIRAECTLWRDDGRDWNELAALAAQVGAHDVAFRWELQAGAHPPTLALHLERSLVNAPAQRAIRLLDEASARLEAPASALLHALRARVLCDLGDLVGARALLDEHSLKMIGAATRAYVATLEGRWMEARDALRTVARAIPPGPLMRSAVGFAAWACDEADLLGSMRAVRQKEDSEDDWVWVRWLAVLVDKPSSREEQDRRRAARASFTARSVERALDNLAAAASSANRARDRDTVLMSARGLMALEEAFTPREHVFEGALLLLQGRALARLGQPERAIDKLTIAESVVARTTGNPEHPWALTARFERAWLRARDRGAPTAEIDDALGALESALWPDHRDVREAQKLRGRL